MVNPYLLTRRELEKIVLTKEGKINLDVPFSYFLAYVGHKKGDNADSFKVGTYLHLRKYEDLTLKDIVKEIKEYGIGKGGLGWISKRWDRIGEKKAEELCRVLSKYGIIKGEVKKYRGLPGKFDS